MFDNSNSNADSTAVASEVRDGDEPLKQAAATAGIEDGGKSGGRAAHSAGGNNGDKEEVEVEDMSGEAASHSTSDKNDDKGAPDPVGRSGRKGYTLVYTGDGKGKTTAAVGLAVRAAGRGLKVLILQFIKSPQRTYGEHITLRKIGIDMRQLGVGFTWTKTPEEHREALRSAWRTAREETMSGQWDVVILDEINNALAIERFAIADVLPLAEVVELIGSRPRHVHLVLTGRSAKPEVIAKADLVSEVQPVKHYYAEGVPAVLGLEF